MKLFKSKSHAELVADIYLELLGRTPDENGLECFLSALKSGMTLDGVRESILESDEYKNRFSKNIVSDLWGKTGRNREQNPLMGWLDSPMILRQYVQPTISGQIDKNWLVGIVENENIQRNLCWLSLGCGAAGQEIYASEMGVFQKMTACDISPGAIDVARKNATLKQISNIEFKTTDIETIRLTPDTYDVVLFNMSLHHVKALEYVLEECAVALRPNGYLIINEYVGPDKMQFASSRLALIDDILSILPDRLKFNYVEKKQKVSYRMRTVAEWDAVDPSEGVRSSEIIQTLKSKFNTQKIIPYGGTLLAPLLEHIIANFEAENENDVGMLNMLILLEKQLIKSKNMESDFVAGIFRNNKSNRINQTAPQS